MKTFVVFAVLALILYWRYKQTATAPKVVPRSVNVPTTSPAFGSQGGLSSYGGSSPGSGQQRAQPILTTTWGIAGGYGIGYTGPSVAPSGSIGVYGSKLAPLVPNMGVEDED